jgi:hypothetical protein
VDAAAQAIADPRTCTCYPGEGPVPCPRKFAMRDCWRAAVLTETQQYIVALKKFHRLVNTTEEACAVPPLEWKGRNLWLGGLYVGCVLHWTQNHPQWWRAWAMVGEEDGTEVGKCPTEDDAKRAVESAVRQAIGDWRADG